MNTFRDEMKIENLIKYFKIGTVFMFLLVIPKTLFFDIDTGIYYWFCFFGVIFNIEAIYKRTNSFICEVISKTFTTITGTSFIISSIIMFIVNASESYNFIFVMLEILSMLTLGIYLLIEPILIKTSFAKTRGKFKMGFIIIVVIPLVFIGGLIAYYRPYIVFYDFNNFKFTMDNLVVNSVTVDDYEIEINEYSNNESYFTNNKEVNISLDLRNSWEIEEVFYQPMSESYSIDAEIVRLENEENYIYIDEAENIKCAEYGARVYFNLIKDNGETYLFNINLYSYDEIIITTGEEVNGAELVFEYIDKTGTVNDGKVWTRSVEYKKAFLNPLDSLAEDIRIVASSLFISGAEDYYEIKDDTLYLKIIKGDFLQDIYWENADNNYTVKIK